MKNGIIPINFNKKFGSIDHIYPTRYSKNYFVLSTIKYKQTKTAISSRGPILWNIILSENLKALTSEEQFKVSDLLLALENEIQYL